MRQARAGPRFSNAPSDRPCVELPHGAEGTAQRQGGQGSKPQPTLALTCLTLTDIGPGQTHSTFVIDTTSRGTIMKTILAVVLSVAVVASSACGGQEKTCLDECAANAARCVAQGLQFCQRAVTGCLDWSTPQACPTGQTCQTDQCALSCSNECTANATRCSEQGVQTCALAASGCTAWGTMQACNVGMVCVDGACRGCTGNFECDTASVCVASRCALAAGREYAFKIVNVSSIVERKPDGSTWDQNGGAPDPWVVLVVDDIPVGVTPVDANRNAFNFTFNYSFTAVVSASSKIEIGVLDYDQGASPDTEFIDGTLWNNGLAWVRAGGFTGLLYRNRAAVEVQVRPR